MRGFGVMFATAAAVAAVTWPFSADAQRSRLLARLETATRVACTFSAKLTGDWTDAGAKVEPSEFEAGFFDIDVDSGTAEAEGRFGASYIIVRYAEGYLHFMQTLSAGPIYLTTVFAEPGTDGRLRAVHTRHEYTAVALPGFTSRPEMYIGECTVE